jgi:hypothetical protein
VENQAAAEHQEIFNIPVKEACFDENALSVVFHPYFHGSIKIIS